MRNLIPFRRRGLLTTLDDIFNEELFLENIFDYNAFKVDVLEEDDHYIVEAELVGIDKSEIKVTLDDNILTISVTKEDKKEETDKNFIHRERLYTSKKRSIHLKNASKDGVTAKLIDGVLTIKIAKDKEISSVKEIVIE